MEIPQCHKLLLLQMACEKLAKAHLIKGGRDPNTLQSSHATVAGTLPVPALKGKEGMVCSSEMGSQASTGGVRFLILTGSRLAFFSLVRREMTALSFSATYTGSAVSVSRVLREVRRRSWLRWRDVA